MSMYTQTHNQIELKANARAFQFYESNSTRKKCSRTQTSARIHVHEYTWKKKDD